MMWINDVFTSPMEVQEESIYVKKEFVG